MKLDIQAKKISMNDISSKFEEKSVVGDSVKDFGKVYDECACLRFVIERRGQRIRMSWDSQESFVLKAVLFLYVLHFLMSIIVGRTLHKK